MRKELTELGDEDRKIMRDWLDEQRSLRRREGNQSIFELAMDEVQDVATTLEEDLRKERTQAESVRRRGIKAYCKGNPEEADDRLLRRVDHTFRKTLKYRPK